MRLLVFIVTLAVLNGGALAGHVTWSDGRQQDGTLQAGPNGTVRLHDGERVREWTLARIAQVAFRTEKERLERAWRFVEAGQTRKEQWGEPFPVAELVADVWLVDGGKVSGHLLSTVLYLETETRTKKVVIKHKLRGQPGQGLDAFVYPVELVFGDGGTTASDGMATVRLESQATDTPMLELAVVSRETMNTAAVRRESNLEHGWRVTLEGGDAIAALRADDEIRVGWRGSGATAARVRLLQGLVDLKDFFDGRELLALAADPDDATVFHTLLLLYRKGGTTLKAKASQPWRLEVWKWRLGQDDDISAARRAVLFRGISAVSAPLPRVTLDAGLAETMQFQGNVRLRTDGGR